MLNFSKVQLPALSQGKRRAPEPQASGDATDIDSRPAKRPHLESPGENQASAPRVTSVSPVVRASDHASHALWSIAPPASWAIAPPVVQPSPPGPLPVWRQPSHAVAHVLPIARHVSAKTVTRLAQVTSPTNALPGIAPQPYRGGLTTQAFEPPRSIGSITNTTANAPIPAANRLARQLLAVPDVPRSAGAAAHGENGQAVDDQRFEWVALRVRDARQIALKHAISVIHDADFYLPRDVTNWLQLCAVLCLHYDAQQDKEPLWQCLERVLLHISCVRFSGEKMRVLHDAVETTLLTPSMPAGFIRILQRAKASRWREDRLSKLFTTAKMTSTLTLAITQMAAGLHPEKTAQQAASDFLLARYAARAVHTAHKACAAHAAHPAPAVASNSPEEVNKFDTVNPEFLFMPFFGEDIIDSDPLPEFWWLADGDYLAARAFEPAGESMSTATTTTSTTPSPSGVTHTAPQLPATPDAPRHDWLVADGDNERSDTESLLNG